MKRNSDLAETKINIAKFRADGEKYFSLFDKHIPIGLTHGSKVLIYKIGNVAAIKGIVDKNPAADYAIYDRECVCKMSKIICPNTGIAGYASDSEGQGKYDIFEDDSMKFDLIIMNPPYSRNLHLKILAEAIRHLKDEKSLCVNLSPVRWLQDPLARYKKTSDFKQFANSIKNHICNIDIYDALHCQTIFSAAGHGDNLGVYICRKTQSNRNISLIPSFVFKILDIASFPTFDFGKKDGFRVRLPIMANVAAGHNSVLRLESFEAMKWFKDGIRNNMPWYQHYQRNQFTKMTDEIPCSIKFNSQIEAENFCKQYTLDFCKVYTHFIKRNLNITPEMVLWLGDAVNPRTGLKGYLGEWTDEDLYAYFNITEDEKKLIESTVAKYNCN